MLREQLSKDRPPGRPEAAGRVRPLPAVALSPEEGRCAGPAAGGGTR
jgi:hypothetical protein